MHYVVKNYKGSLKWYLIDIIGPQITRGIGVSNFIKLIQTIANLKFAILYEIEGIGDNIEEITEYDEEDKVFNLDQLFKAIEPLKMSWGDFYLFRSYPVAWVNNREFSEYASLLIQSEVLVRVHDGFMLSIYTPDENVVNFIKSNCNVQHIEFGFIKELPFATG